MDVNTRFDHVGLMVYLYHSQTSQIKFNYDFLLHNAPTRLPI